MAGNNGTVLVVSLFAVENRFFNLRHSILSQILQAIGVRQDLERFPGMVISKFNSNDIRDVQMNLFSFKEALEKSVRFMIDGGTTGGPGQL